MGASASADIEIRQEHWGVATADGRIVRSGVENLQAEVGEGHPFICTARGPSEAGPWTLWYVPDRTRPDERMQLLEGLKQRAAFDILKALAKGHTQQHKHRRARDLHLMAMLERSGQ